MKFKIVIPISIFMLFSCADWELEVENPYAEPNYDFTIEYDWMEYYDVQNYYDASYQIYDFWITNLTNPFEFGGTKSFSWTRDNERLPEYGFAGFPDNDVLLQQYAKEHRDGDLDRNYHLLSVNNYENPSATGGSNAAEDMYNRHFQPKEIRYSFIFWGNIQDLFENPNNPEQEELDYQRVTMSSAVHELGHQRYALSHQTNNPQSPYHSYAIDCVMQQAYFEEYAVFCYDGYEDEIDNSCQDFLIKANRE